MLERQIALREGEGWVGGVAMGKKKQAMNLATPSTSLASQSK
jgi:hypothetical protein